ncbi:MAG: hypothetical protein ACTSU4_01125 [Promethearchaeota archaeon]
MFSQKAILCKLGGYVNANPEIVSSFPPLEESEKDYQELLQKCFPIGSKPGTFAINKYKKDNLLSFIFKIKKEDGRDDLLSFSILIDKKLEAEYYKPIVEEIITSLNNAGILNEDTLIKYHQEIYESINQEKDLKIESLSIPLSKLFKTINAKIKKEKPQLKGSFF